MACRFISSGVCLPNWVCLYQMFLCIQKTGSPRGSVYGVCSRVCLTGTHKDEGRAGAGGGTEEGEERDGEKGSVGGGEGWWPAEGGGEREEGGKGGVRVTVFGGGGGGEGGGGGKWELALGAAV